jgi:hypothetical protein
VAEKAAISGCRRLNLRLASQSVQNNSGICLGLKYAGRCRLDEPARFGRDAGASLVVPIDGAAIALSVVLAPRWPVLPCFRRLKGEIPS